MIVSSNYPTSSLCLSNLRIYTILFLTSHPRAKACTLMILCIISETCPPCPAESKCDIYSSFAREASVSRVDYYILILSPSLGGNLSVIMLPASSEQHVNSV